ncbi:MAG: 50S ribosomal protein L10 [Gammaproteobacteria bacterium]
MPLTSIQKQAIVDRSAQVVAGAVSIVVAEYRGLTVAEMTQLRANARQQGVVLRVIRNTLARRALAETAYQCLAEALVGPVILAFSIEAPSAAARLLRDFAKEHEQLKVTALAVDGQLVAVKDLAQIASLPNREEALVKLMLVMKAPIEKLARTLAEPQAKLVRVLAAIRDQKQ